MGLYYGLRPDVWQVAEQPSGSWAFRQPEFLHLAQVVGLSLGKCMQIDANGYRMLYIYIYYTFIYVCI